MLNLFQHLVLSFMGEILNRVQDDRSVKFQICLARYLENAKEILSKARIEDNRYADDKYVKSACGVDISVC